MKRIISVLAVAALLVMMLVAMAAPAFAQKPVFCAERGCADTPQECRALFGPGERHCTPVRGD